MNYDYDEQNRDQGQNAAPDGSAGAQPEKMVDLFEIAENVESEEDDTAELFAMAEEYSDDEEDEDEEYSDDDEEEDEEYSDDDEEEDEEYSDDDEEEDEEYSDDEEEDDEEYSDDDEEEDEEYFDDEEEDDEEYSDDEEEEDEEYSDDEEEDDEEYSDDDEEEDEEYSDDEEEDDEEYSDDEEEDDEEYSDDEEEEDDGSGLTADEVYRMYFAGEINPNDEEYASFFNNNFVTDDYPDQSDDDEYSDEDEDDEYSDEDEDDEYSDEDEDEDYSDDDDVFDASGDMVDIMGFSDLSDEEASVDLFEDTVKSDDLPETESHSAFYYWAKHKTVSGWVRFGLKCVGCLLLVLVVSGVLYFNGLLNMIDFKAADDFEQFYNLSDTDYQAEVDDVYSTPVYYNESTTIKGFTDSMIDIPKKDVLNILLIGTDVRGGTYEDRGNTDSMILVSVNTRDKNIKLTSFMRDMYVSIPDRGWARLNAAYAYGGPQLLFDTLKENFDVDVDLYVRVNFANFRKIVNHVGGVDIELSEAEAKYMNKYMDKYKTDPVEPGWQRLDGAQALSYARCRKIDSDFNRTKRQRTVIIALVKEIKHSSPAELNSLLNVFLPMIQTNMSKMQILGLMADGTRYLNTDIETLNIPIKNSWRTETIRKMSVICPNFDLNKTAITAHIYSTYRLDVEGTTTQSTTASTEASAPETAASETKSTVTTKKSRK